MPDITGHWAENAVLHAANLLGIINGYTDGTFKPNNPVTRAEFINMLVKAFQLKSTGDSLKFSDLDKIGKWAHEAVTAAVASNIVVGYQDDSFRPSAPSAPRIS
ncbi:S-layer homology domain-containing protein [Paenibacillus nasutitermitis]|uniref:SLH domain-containing protein n=1 Tax=Paenibacillus nasutitermitis TaxID=1652958 RepID=A0A916ZCK8_9BACL|nr:S-layer homology domain-containing protein [Paenibacillus nasutitermitis]GGD88228.1 hypothetical protein GCM10010911_53440 [Paenibacillus nasutitermitis]